MAVSYDIMSSRSSRDQNGGIASINYDYDGSLGKVENLKRPLMLEESSASLRSRSDSDNDLDCEPAAKIKRSRDRRKQSKPVRMYADMDGVTDGDPTKRAIAQHSDLSGDSCVDSHSRMTDVQDTHSYEEIPCDLCDELFRSKNLLKIHMDNVHVIDADEAAKVEGDAFPTRYHQLGSELQQGQGSDSENDEEKFCERSPSRESDVPVKLVNIGANWEMPKLAEIDATPSDGSQKKTEKNMPRINDTDDQFLTKYHQLGNEIQQMTALNFARSDKSFSGENEKHGSDGSMAQFDSGVPSNEAHASPSWDSNGKSRIFHPDAYCEICDREFCNKYFLKTHKANKHGIYDGAMGSLDLAALSADGFAMSGMLPQDSAPPSLFLPMKTSPQKLPDSANTSPSLTNPNLPPNVNNNRSRDTSPLALKTNSEADDYSRNVKKLKQESSHSLQSSAERGNRSSGANGLSSAFTSSGLTNLSTSHPLMVPNLTSSVASSMPPMNDFQQRMANLMLLHPFANPLGMIPSLFPGAPAGFGFGSGSLPAPPIPFADLEKLGALSRFSDSSILPNNLPNMGVLNAEAFMDFFRKEFSNNYLRSQQDGNGRGLFPNGLPNFPPGLSAAGLAGGNIFGLNNKTEVVEKEDSFVKKEKQDVFSEVCEICKKTFVNKSAFIVHLVTMHNIKPDSSDLASEIKMLDKLNDEYHFEKSVFGHMVAAKLVDRVQCDICNKEVCNKYFLKTHKIKVHGCDPAVLDQESQDRSPGKQPSPSQMPSTCGDQLRNIPDMTNIEKPKEEELLQLGIDPEAYCEICKKEFCNKYFLKTHKQNIHGIKMAATSIAESKSVGMPMESWNFPPPNLCQQVGNNNSMAAAAAHLGLLAGNPMQQMNNPMNLNPPALLPQQSDSSSQDSTEKRSWKWKEPVNAMRVMCEICNKVLCNKYFLKTHMMKRHNLNYDTITGQLTNNEGGLLRLPGDFHALKQENTFREYSPGKLMQQNYFRPDGGDEKGGSPSREHLTKDQKENFASDQSKDEDDFVHSKGFHRQDSDHNIAFQRNNSGSGHETPVSTVLLENGNRSSAEMASSVNTVMAKTWHVPAISSSHRDLGEDFVRRNSSSSDLMLRGDDEFHVLRCSYCDTVFCEEATMKLHMLKDHGHAMQSPHKVEQNSDPLECLKENGDMLAGKSDNVMDSAADATKAAIANHIRSQQKRKMYRCTYCRERFHHRLHCEAHIRSKHPHSGNDRNMNPHSKPGRSDHPRSSVNGLTDRDRNESRNERNHSSPPTDPDASGKQPVIYAQPVEQFDSSKFLMQPFVLKESGGQNHFATSLVYLPTLQKIIEPVSVTFSLTPIMQQ